MRLCKIGLSEDATCRVCGLEEEGFRHLFFLCVRLKSFKSMMEKVVNGFLCNSAECPVWEELLIFGFSGKTTNSFALNLFLAVARYAIFQRRAIVRQRGKPLPLCAFFKRRLTYFVGILHDYFYTAGETERFWNMVGFNNPFIVYQWSGYDICLPQCEGNTVGE